MSSSAAISNPSDQRSGRLSVTRCALTGAVVFAVLFVLCWLTSLFSVFSGMHMNMATFAMGASGPIVTLVFGLVCSTAAGLFVGALTAFTYNAFAFLAR